SRCPLLLYSRLLPSPRTTPFPYTTLFRSLKHLRARMHKENPDGEAMEAAAGQAGNGALRLVAIYGVGRKLLAEVMIGVRPHVFRSEEHTSELQSRENLVCRLLLEKKNNNM